MPAMLHALPASLRIATAPSPVPAAALLRHLNLGRRWRWRPLAATPPLLLPPWQGPSRFASTAAAAACGAAGEGVEPDDINAAHACEQQEEGPYVEYCVVNFYHLVDLPRPHELINQSRAYLADKDVRGRIYFSEQGVNAQFGGGREAAEGYALWLAATYPAFADLRYSVWPVVGHAFPKLRLKYRPNLISLAGGMQGLPITDPAARATPLEPASWRKMLREGVGGKPPLVLDLRNGYEWDAGHFAGAERPREDEFNETPTEATPAEVPAPLAAADADTPVMMYCTGGIRCDVYSAYLKQKGYRNLFSLEGGIQNYMRSEGLDRWRGSLFVFDGRMAIRPDKGVERPLEAAAPCQVCDRTAVLPHINCANIDCNKLFMACEECRAKLRGCCCEACIDAPRLLRAPSTPGLHGNFRPWSEYVSQDEAKEVEAAMASGRGPGRASRRQRRKDSLKERNLSKRVLKVERRRHGKEVMAAAAGEGQGQEAGQGEGEGADKMAKLRELRTRLAETSASA